jgi:hypothetical protein
MVPHPDVDPALGVVAGLHAFLERVPRALGVGRGRLGLAQEIAQVEKMLLAGRAFAERDALPLANELLRAS